MLLLAGRGTKKPSSASFSAKHLVEVKEVGAEALVSCPWARIFCSGRQEWRQRKGYGHLQGSSHLKRLVEGMMAIVKLASWNQ
jgi:hypothetical protein